LVKAILEVDDDEPHGLTSFEIIFEAEGEYGLSTLTLFRLFIPVVLESTGHCGH